MSGIDVKSIPIIPNEVRDYYTSFEGTTTKIIPIWEKEGAIGLDWHVFNTGASSVVVLLDSTHTITVPAGGDRGFNNIKYGLIKVTATTAYTLIVAGVIKRKMGRL